MQQFIDARPVGFRHSALFGLCIANVHCLGPKIGMFFESFRRDVIDYGRRFGKGL